MRYSKNQLNKAGEHLIGTDPFLRSEAVSTIQSWRESHVAVMQELNVQLLRFFETNRIAFGISSMRIKRMPSIEAKLRNNSGMKLGGVQDIGGIRFVFDSIEGLDGASSLLNGFVPEGFELVKRRDYVESPKASGYRGIHYVYKRHSGEKDYDGISIELQIRTRMQHAWAMAVETAGLISNATLKADIDDNSEWRGFFKLVSALFARDENRPVHEDFADYDQQRFCTEFFRYEENRLLDRLRALSVTVSDDFGNGSGYCVLTIDFINKIVHAQTFGREREGEAAELFGRIEQTINRDEAALMVAIEDLREMKEAYPSYFLDTQKFIAFLSDFERQCGTLMKA